MYNTSTALASALSIQKLYTKVVCGSTTIGAEQVKKCVYSAAFGGADSVTIGGVTAASVSLTLSGTYAFKDKTVSVSVGAEVNGAVQYVPLGTFVVTACKQGDGTTTLTAYDAAYYALGGTYTPAVSSGTTVAAVLADVTTQCGLSVATLPAAASTTTVTGDLTGKTCREMVGYLAALVGCNALIDRDGKLALRWFASSGQSYGPSDYYNAGLSIDGANTLTCIRAEVEKSTTDADGNTSVTTDTYTAGGTGANVTIQNPYMTQTILDAVWASIGGLTYTVGSCDIFHGLLTEPGDLVTITDKAGASHTLAVMSLTMTIDGGCKTTLRATGESDTDSSAAMQGGLGRKVSQLVVDLAKVKRLIIEDANGVTKISGGHIDTDSLFAQDITASGNIKSDNYNGTNATPLQNTKGSILKMDDGSFNLGGGALVYSDGKLTVKGRIAGAEIDITGAYNGYSGDNLGYIRTESADEVNEGAEPQLTMGVGDNYVEIRGSDSLGMGIEIVSENVYIGRHGASHTTTVHGTLFVDKIEEPESHEESYSDFSGGVISSGTINVVKHLGWCHVFGEIKLTGTVSNWTEVLTSAQVPRPAMNENIYAPSTTWGTSFVRAPRIQINGNGGLRVRYGAAATYNFSASYPI